MTITNKLVNFIVIFLTFLVLQECTNKIPKVDPKFHLVTEAYNVAVKLFNQSRVGYERLKDQSLLAIDTFLDLVKIINNEMAKELRAAIIKFYKLRYFHDFTNYIITIEDMIDITEHCLTDPEEKLDQIRAQFQAVIGNFQDVRHFDTVDKCFNELPDEVASAHCILHQAVLFNETMQESLVKIVEIKTRQHAQDMNASFHDVRKCLNDFVPDLFQNLLVDSYTETSGFIKIVNASALDLFKDKWRSANETMFQKKWGPLVMLLKEKSNFPRQRAHESIYLSLFAANLSSNDIVTTLFTN